MKGIFYFLRLERRILSILMNVGYIILLRSCILVFIFHKIHINKILYFHCWFAYKVVSLEWGTHCITVDSITILVKKESYKQFIMLDIWVD